MNVGMPGVKFINNTFYRSSYQQSGIGYGGTLKRGDASRGLLQNNVFVAGGKSPDPYGYKGFYSNSGASLSNEVLLPLSPDQTVGSGIYSDLILNMYINSNGQPQDKAKALTGISQFVLSDLYASYKPAVYDLLIKTLELDASIRSTFVADYNFVSEDAPLFAAKSARCSDPRYIGSNFCESHGINGGDPKFVNIIDPDGPDNIPFTLDDGLKPLPTSPFCGKGEGGTDIGALSCNANTVFVGGGSGTIFTSPPPPPPSDTTPSSIPTGLTATAISSSQINLSWTASTDNVAVAGYRIYRGRTQIGTSATNSYSNTGLTASTLYSYTVSAYDAAGNNSSQSSSVSATTQALLPLISNLVGSNTTDTTTKISWNTNVLT
ncbi:MAG: fibronectin type III domain-containing protein, partial [Rectinemataceae bacterium]|nr:fibronectin type III domain-containing protein [Rectinemataceae bacterium]